MDVRELHKRLFDDNDDLIYGWGGLPEDRPNPGDRTGYSWVELTDPNPSLNAPAAFMAVPATLWGDYTGDDVQRSNHRSLLRDYPDTFIEAEGGHSSHSLMLPIDGEINTALADIIVRLAHEYPLYDEEDHSALIMELVDEAWDSYLLSDVESALSELTGIDLADLHPVIQQRGTPGDSRTYSDILYTAYCSYEGNEWTGEGAVSVRNGRHAEAVRHVARIVLGWEG